MAKTLIESMTAKWDPEAYKDDYREALKEMIEEKIKHPGKERTKPAAKKRPANVIDLVEVLQQSIREGTKKPKARAAATRASGKRRRRAA